MKGIKDFVVHIPKRYNDTYKTEGGLELHADIRWSPRELANTIVTVTEPPLNYSGDIKKGTQVFLDTTAILDHEFNNVTQKAKYCIDHDKDLYKIDPSLIIAYKNNNDWIGFKDNVIVEKIYTDNKKIKSSLIFIPEGNNKKQVKGIAKLVVGNSYLKNFEGVDSNENVFINDDLEIDIIFKGKNMLWLKNRDIVGKQLKSAV